MISLTKYKDYIDNISINNQLDNIAIVKIYLKSGKQLDYVFDLTHSISDINKFLNDEIEKTIRTKKLNKIKGCLKET